MSPHKHVVDVSELGVTVYGWSDAEALIKCPYHGADKTPSAELNVVTGLFHCFTCGKSVTASQLAVDLGTRLSMVPRRATPSNVDVPWRTLLEAPSAEDDHYAKGRGVTRQQILHFGIRSTSVGIVFPMFDTLDDYVNDRPCGVLLRRAQAGANPRYLSLGKRPATWPMQNMIDIDPLGLTPVTEGVFGVLAAHRAGVAALTVFSCSFPLDNAATLRSLSPVVCFDADEPGYMGAGRFLATVPNAFVAVPGREWDEMNPRQWENTYQQMRAGLGITRSHVDLAHRSGNPGRYWREIKKAVRQNAPRPSGAIVKDWRRDTPRSLPPRMLSEIRERR